MGRRKSRKGICHICGRYTDLTFEHVPPRAAFNEHTVILVNFEEAIQAKPGERPKGEFQQRGAGAYTLCASCNNNTGAWYGKHFVEWCYQGMEIIARSGGTPTLINLHYVFPLSIIKQIITMFFSANPETFGEANPELVRFVLNCRERHLSPKYRIFVYLNNSVHLRYEGITARVSVGSSKMILLSEIAFPPFGYVMTIDSESPDRRLVEITHFAQYEYKKFDVLTLQIPLLPVATHLPGDYRSEAEVTKAVEEAEGKNEKKE